MKKIKSDYLQKEVGALEALIVFKFMGRYSGETMDHAFKGFWLETGEIKVAGFADYQAFIDSIYQKQRDLSSVIVDSFIQAVSVSDCYSDIGDSSDEKASYTDTAIISQEIQKIKMVEQEKKKLETTLKKVKSKKLNVKVSKI